jgi:glycosyltransferase involved in cell wall biosynthesis
MSCFDALVLTTKLETFGLVLIEAMHSGIPVIGSNAGGVPEIIDNEVTGLLFESWNANSLAEALKRLYTDREFGNKIAIMGRQKAQKIFDAKIQYQKVFQTMCGGKSISAY